MFSETKMIYSKRGYLRTRFHSASDKPAVAGEVRVFRENTGM